MKKQEDGEEDDGMEERPINGERAFEDTDASKHQKIVGFVNSIKDEFTSNSKVVDYFKDVEKLRRLVDQKWGQDKTTRFGLRHSLMRATYDSYVDTFSDLFDVDDLITMEGDTKEEAMFAKDMQLFTNRMLRSVKFQRHLNSRFLFLPIYGWSPAHDTYRINEGWATQANAKTVMPNLQQLQFTKKMDVLNDGAVPELLRPEHCFFGSMAPAWEQTTRGSVKRWYLSDVIAAEKKRTKDGKPLYNPEALKKMRMMLAKGEKDADSMMKESAQDAATKDINFRDDKARGPFVDVIRFYGPLNEIPDHELAEDGNTYYIECTRNALLLWIENPADRHTMYTDMRTHELYDSPLSRNLLEPSKGHQQFTDFLTNMSMESVVDNLTKHWAVWPEDMENPGDFYNPKGLNAFLRMQGQGRTPQIVQAQRSGAFADIKDILTMLDRDRQRGSASDQEMGAMGNTQDKTATAARILASAASKKTRAIIKRISNDAIVPQVQNLVMLTLVHSKPEMLKFISGGKDIQITPEHVAWYLNGANVRVNNTVIMDRNEEAMKITSFFQGVGQMVGQLADPSAAVYIMRHAADIQGIPQHIIDKALPEPMPPQITTTPKVPPAQVMPAEAVQPNPIMEQNANAEMVPAQAA